jgi:glycosyltransferase involved in cell wall biosynthesis
MRTRTGPLVSVVVPLQDEQANVEPLAEAIASALHAPFEIVLVDDGSTDTTWEQIRGLCAHDSRVRGISLTRNFGHQNALFAGLHQARGSAVITMDGDFQHPPGLLPELLKAWSGGAKVVNTCRRDPPLAPRFKRISSRWFYRLFSLLSGVKVCEGSSDFRLIDREVLVQLLQMKDTDLFVRGIVNWLGFPSTTIEYETGRRRSGATKYSLRRMCDFASGALISFSTLPLKAGLWIGTGLSVVALLGGMILLVEALLGTSIPGERLALVGIGFGFGLLLAMLGVLGAYLGKVFEILKNRPHFVISTTAGTPEPQTSSVLPELDFAPRRAPSVSP